MKRILSIIFVVLTIFSAPVATLGEDLPARQGDATDAVLRAEIRLSDLGYGAEPVHGVLDEYSRDVLRTYRQGNGFTTNDIPEPLFANDATSAPYGGWTLQKRPGGVAVFGAPMGWDTAKTLLIPGETYTVTSCYSGIAVHLVCVSTDGHGEMRPELEWDGATLSAMFGDLVDYRKLPVVIVLDQVRVGASLQLSAGFAENRITGDCELFFTGCVSNVASLPDADHEAVIEVACGK